MTAEANRVELYTDGACKGNPGPGGWGVLLRYNGRVKELHGGEADTTNNRMELMAAIKGLEALNRPCSIALYTDSKYVMTGMNEWIHRWKLKGWKTADNKPVKNVDLWQQLDLLVAKHDIQWHWVRGHSGHDGNEAADRLANMGVSSLQKEI